MNKDSIEIIVRGDSKKECMEMACQIGLSLSIDLAVNVNKSRIYYQVANDIPFNHNPKAVEGKSVFLTLEVVEKQSVK